MMNSQQVINRTNRWDPWGGDDAKGTRDDQEENEMKKAASLMSLALAIVVGWIAAPPPRQAQITPLAAQQFDRKQKLAELRRQIAGKERTPAEQVYKNIQDYKGAPAAGLLRGMEFYTQALGVDCLHCHVADRWENDDRPAKQIAREMSALVDNIQESLKKIKGLKSERPGISCATCHRGQLKPAISLTSPQPETRN